MAIVSVKTMWTNMKRNCLMKKANVLKNKITAKKRWAERSIRWKEGVFPVKGRVQEDKDSIMALTAGSNRKQHETPDPIQMPN